jgi:hypothetical protein
MSIVWGSWHRLRTSANGCFAIHYQVRAEIPSLRYLFPFIPCSLLQYTEKTKYDISQRNYGRKKDELDHGGEIQPSDASS